MVHNQGGELAEYRGLSAFTRHDPPKFEGGFNPEVAQRWVADVEKMFNVIGCHEENKVAYATYLLCGEGEDWWRFAGQTLPQEDGYIQWKTFKIIFLGNYFPRNLRKQKAREFLELKQRSMTVGEYAAKFQELMKIFEANSRGKTVDTRGAGPVRQDRRPSRFSRGPYSGSNSSQSRGSSSQERSSGSGSGSSSFRGSLKCFKCGGSHMVKDCPQPRITCSNCGKLGHIVNECWAAKRGGSASTAQRPESRESRGQVRGRSRASLGESLL
ncbi:uncharacterized protein LOC113871422 [Abrus precatorius]|uniref:Uncharacterized protein LOC113871422 n=1 Tax=Abrus precatorius TaxID=3816 RepID=A0A8B8MB56_ABRPR|nr:uncharacterized protein LOC113871422 [Abrus precatorius]